MLRKNRNAIAEGEREQKDLYSSELRNESKSTSAEEELRDKISLLQKIAHEKCRLFREKNVFLPIGFPNADSFIWSKNECKSASKDVVEQVEALYKFKYNK